MEEVKEEKPVVKKKKKVAEVVAEVAAPEEGPKLVTVKAGGHKVTGFVDGTKITTLDGVTYDL